MWDNNISDEGFIEFCNAIKYIPNILELVISNNKIGDEGIKVLGDNLKYIPQLSLLQINSKLFNLIDNKFEHEGIKTFSNNFQNNTNLTRLIIACII